MRKLSSQLLFHLQNLGKSMVTHMSSKKIFSFLAPMSRLNLLPRLVMFAILLTILIYSLSSRTSQHTIGGLQRFYVQGRENGFLVYKAPIAPQVEGIPFNEVDGDLFRSLLPDPVELREENLENFVFVSAVSEKYIRPVKYLIHTIQKFYPQHKLIIFDLGLKDEHVQMLTGFCQVNLRKFDFSKYPGHVNDLRNFAFKPIAITEVMKEGTYDGIFWVDASIRFKSGDLTILHKKATESNGLAAFTGTDHSIYAVTMPQMFDHLPIVKNPKIVECLLSSAVLMYRTNTVINNIIQWWLACALSKGCMADCPYSGCPFARDGRNRWTEFGYCSRYDQSALSILLYNTYSNIDAVLAYRLWGSGIEGAYLRINREDSSDMIKKCNVTK